MSERRADRAVRNLAVGILALSGAAALVPTGSEAADPNCTVIAHLRGPVGFGATVRGETPQGVKLGEVSLANGAGDLSLTGESVNSNGQRVLRFVLRSGASSSAVIEKACGTETDFNNITTSASRAALMPTATVTVRANTPTPKSEPTATSTPIPGEKPPVPPAPKENSSDPNWLGLALGVLGLGVLTGVGIWAYRARNRHPNQPNNPNNIVLPVPVTLNVQPINLNLTPNLQNPNNPNVAPGAPTQALPATPTAPMQPAARPARRFIPARRGRRP